MAAEQAAAWAQDGGTGDVPWTAPEVEWKSDLTPAELVRFACLSSNSRMWAYLRRLARQYPDVLRLAEIGRSDGGLPIFAARLGRPAADENGTIRVLMFAQQHGDEPAGKEACLLLIRDLAAGRGDVPLDRLSVWIVPQVNPDGAELGTRQNRRGQDLNRGHHLLPAPEHRALYGLLHRVAPHLTVDLHELNDDRNESLAQGTLSAYDLMAEGPTNLNVSPALRELGQTTLRSVGQALEESGFAYRRYLLGDPSGSGRGKIPRYSTLHAFDGRNTPALFGALSFITEATRHSCPIAGLDRRVRACHAAACAFLRFAAAHTDEIVERVADERARLAAGPGSRVVLRAGYRLAPQRPPLRYAYVRTGTGEVSEYALAEARTETEVTGQRELPLAYWLDLPPADPALSELLRTFEGHRVVVSRLARPGAARVESYVVERSTSPGAVDAAPGVRVTGQILDRELPAGALLVRTAQLGGRLTALLLEPESMDGPLARGAWSLESAAPYPFRRVLALDSRGRLG